VDGPKRSPDASWASILPGPAPTALDGFRVGFGLALLGFIVGHFDPCLGSILSSKWASFPSHGFL
jgi:hypothetical protein